MEDVRWLKIARQLNRKSKIGKSQTKIILHKKCKSDYERKLKNAEKRGKFCPL